MTVTRFRFKRTASEPSSVVLCWQPFLNFKCLRSLSSSHGEQSLLGPRRVTVCKIPQVWAFKRQLIPGFQYILLKKVASGWQKPISLWILLNFTCLQEDRQSKLCYAVYRPIYKYILMRERLKPHWSEFDL